MISEEFLTKAIHEYFDPIFQKFSFQYLPSQKTNRNIYFFYQKPEFLVRIQYNYPNQYLEVDFFKETDVNKLIGAPFIALRHIIKDKSAVYNYLDYEAIMPKVIPIEKSVESVAKLVEKYTTSYLEGKEWKTWRDVGPA